MLTSLLPNRRRRLGALLAGLCLAAGSIGTTALADPGSGSTVTVEARVMVQAGMSPIHARQAVTSLNSAIDSSARSIAQSATAALRSGRPVRSTAAATRSFANRIDAALTQFTVASVSGLDAAGTATNSLVSGSLAALEQVVRSASGAISYTTGAEVSVASGSDGTSVSASLNPVVDLALRQAIGNTVRAIRPVLPLTRTTVRAVAGGVRQVVDASVVAVSQIIDSSADFVAVALNLTGTTLVAVRAVASSAVNGGKAVVAATDEALDNLSDVNITAAVDASLRVTAT